MKRLILLAALLAASAIVAAADSRAASTRCVGGSGCYATLASAIAAAQDGDTIRVNAGTFAGGVTITKSITLTGAGAQRTTIKGGGPVLTIGTIFATDEPTVSISGLTITGGVTSNSPESQAFVGADNVIALGGGIEVPPNADFSGGAVVTITDSVITGNRASPTATQPFGPPCPDGNACPFAWAGGGGIDTWGALTLTNTTVSSNLAGGSSGVASDNEGAGVFAHLAAVTITQSTIINNRAIGNLPNARFADGGGVFVTGGSLAIDHTLVSGNSVSLSAAFPGSVETAANGAGVHIGGDDDCVDVGNCVAASIDASVISGNSVSATNSGGDAVAFCGGICNDGALTLQSTNVSGNSVDASSPVAGASGDSAGLGEGGPATISNSSFTNNAVTATGSNGLSVAQAGGLSTGDQDVATTITGTTVSGNHVTARSASGQAVVFGAGMSNGGLLTVQASSFSQNVAQAKGPSGSAHGGGIWNSDFGGGPGSTLTLSNSVVRNNSLVGQKGITVSGGGLYNTATTVLTGNVIRANSPDDCAGVSC